MWPLHRRPHVHLLVIGLTERSGSLAQQLQLSFMKRTTPQATYDRSDDLTFYIHDAATSFRFEIEGSLSGKAARQVEQSWRTAAPVIGDRSLVVALGHLSRIDTFGRALIRRWHESGAQFVVKSPLAKTILSSIRGRPQISAIKGTKCDDAAGSGRSPFHWFHSSRCSRRPRSTLPALSQPR